MTDKDKYFEQATQKTGILSDVVKVLNRFVEDYDFAKLNMKQRITELKNSLVPKQNQMEIFDDFNARIEYIRNDSVRSIQDIVKQVKTEISRIIASNLPNGAMDDIQSIERMEGHLTDEDVKTYLDKYRKCYLVTKTLFKSMDAVQAKRLGIDFISADDIIESLESIENVSVNLIKKYNGFVPYEFVTMLDGKPIQTVNDAFNSFAKFFM